MQYRTVKDCPRGNETCVKICYGEQCLKCKYEPEECCKEYCIFDAGSLITKVQTGEVEANKVVDEILRS
ncbi:hypothetical protein ES705_09383 [subsurface metagenome]